MTSTHIPRRLARRTSLVLALLALTTLVGPVGPSLAGPAIESQGVAPAYIIPLFPQKERNLKKGLPPGMTAYSFWAARGTMALTTLPDGKVGIEFDFDGLIPYGLYTLWNVLETDPFRDEPLGPFGYGKHSVVADGSGTIVFVNRGTQLHSPTLIDHEDLLDQAYVKPGQMVSFVVPDTLPPGTYTLGCNVHVDMTAKIVVDAGP